MNTPPISPGYGRCRYAHSPLVTYRKVKTTIRKHRLTAIYSVTVTIPTSAAKPAEVRVYRDA
jgi:hypothetical protein